MLRVLHREANHAVREVSLSLLSGDEIRQMSVLHVTTDIEWGPGNQPRSGGLLDPVLGAVSAEFPCRTCGGVMRSPDVQAYVKDDAGVNECPGHMGHVSLPVPVFTVASLEEAYRVLASFCPYCGLLLLTPAQAVRVKDALRLCITDTDRLRVIYTAARGKRFCAQGCLRTLPAISKRSGKAPRGSDHSDWFPLQACWPDADAAGAVPSPPGVLGKTLAVTAARADAALAKAQVETLAREYGMFGGREAGAREFRASLTLDVLPVPPPCARPSNIVFQPGRGGGGAGPAQGPRITLHAVTQKFQLIMQRARKLQRKMSACDAPARLATFADMSYAVRFTLDEYAALQWYVNMLHDGKAAGPPPPIVPLSQANKPSMLACSMAQQLHGKAGRMRGNLMGKRSEFTARTVIGAEPNVAFNAVAVPRQWAETLTVPERVTPLNRHVLQRDAAAAAAAAADDSGGGGGVDASTRSMFDKSGRGGRKLAHKPYDAQSEAPLETGTLVERRLRDGDVVVINRQPTLHGPSMQAFRVVLQSRKTMAFGLDKTKGFNADFDGDEMNLHVPQTVEARAEAEELMMSAQQLLLPAKNAPIIGQQQDSLVAVWLMTRRDCWFTRDEAMDLLMHINVEGMIGASVTPCVALPAPAIMKPVERWTGKQLVSLALPPVVTVHRDENDADLPLHDDDDDDDDDDDADDDGGGGWMASTARDRVVLVRRGQLHAGRLTSKTVGATAGSFQHIIATSPSYGGNEAVRRLTIAAYFESMQALAGQFLMLHGFSIGISDVGLLCSRNTTQAGPCFRLTDDAAAMCPDCRQSTAVNRGANAAVTAIRDYVEQRTCRPATDGGGGGSGSGDVQLDEHITSIEQHVIRVQDTARDTLGAATSRFFQRSRRTNAVLDMMLAGSKGNATTLAQMACMVGGQMIRGARVIDNDAQFGPSPPPVSQQLDGRPSHSVSGRYLSSPRFRPLPHFVRCYPAACEGGFVMPGFVVGLDPWAFFAHAMATRPNLVDTALNTQDAGYLQRRMMKCTEDLIVAYDGTVRNTNGRVIQFEAGAASSRVQRKDCPAVTRWTQRQVVQRLTWAGRRHRAAVAAWPVLARESVAVVEAVQRLQYLVTLDRDGGLKLFTTGHIERVLADLAAAGAAGDDDDDDEDAEPDTPGLLPAWEAAQLVEDWLASMQTKRLLPDEVHGLEARIVLCSKLAVTRWKFASDGGAFREVLHRVEQSFAAGRLEPGDAVGAIAAMSMGEPTTQMTLNTFHAAGTSSAKVGGVQRCNELIVATPTDKQKTPVVRTYLAPALEQQADAEVQRQLQRVTPLGTHALDHELPYDWKTLLRCCPVDGGGGGGGGWRVAASGTAFEWRDTGGGASAAWRGLSDEALHAGFTVRVLEQFGLFYLHTLRIDRSLGCVTVLPEPRPRGGDAAGRGRRRERERHGLLKTLPASLADVLAAATAVPGFRFSAFHLNRRGEQALLGRVVAWTRANFPSAESRTRKELDKRARFARLVPVQQALRTVLLGSLVRQCTVDYHPLDWTAAPGGGGDMYLRPRDAPADEQDRWLFDSAIADADSGNGARVGQRRPLPAADDDDDDGRALAADGAVAPNCRSVHGGRPCLWRDELHVACLSGFVATMWLDSRMLAAVNISPVRLEEEMMEGPLASCYVVHVGEACAETGLTALRLRARMCRAYTVTAAEQLRDLDEVRDLQTVMQSLYGVCISGPPGTRHVSIQTVTRPAARQEDGGRLALATELALDVATRDLQYVLAMPAVNAARTTTNMVHEAVAVLGIEAGRAALLREFEEMIASGSCYVDRHHVAVLADVMTSTGTFRGFKYHDTGMLRNDVITQASYERQAQTFIRGAVNGVCEPVASPATAICLGQPVPRLGTAAVQLLLDDAALAAAMPVVDEDAWQHDPRQALKLGTAAAAAGRRHHHHRHDAERSRSGDGLPFAARTPLASEHFVPSPQQQQQQQQHFGYSPLAEGSLQFSPVSAGGGGDHRFVPFAAFTQQAAQATASATGSTFTDLYSPSSPSLLTSPAYMTGRPAFSPSSPTYSPTSPTYSPASPRYSPASPNYSPASPAYSPTSPTYRPTSPTYSPTSPTYSPTSPTYSPASPAYSPASPAYSPTAAAMPARAKAHGFGQTQQPYSPTSPGIADALPFARLSVGGGGGDNDDDDGLVADDDDGGGGGASREDAALLGQCWDVLHDEVDFAPSDSE